MAQAISVRLDDEALRALARLETTGLSRSAAIRLALVTAAARLRDRQTLAAEVVALEADEADRAEIREVAELMEQLRGCAIVQRSDIYELRLGTGSGTNNAADDSVSSSNPTHCCRDQSSSSSSSAPST
jgi:hypothetical protein